MSEMELEDLRNENARLHDKLTAMNNEVDRMLRNRTQAKKKPTGKRNLETAPMEVRQAMAKNEQLRKESLRLRAEMQHSDTALKITETKNLIGTVKLEMEAINEDIRGLENVQKNQETVATTAQGSEEELVFLREEHRQQLNQYREEVRLVKDQKDADERVLLQHQRRYHAAHELVLLNINKQQFDDLKDSVENQTVELENMRSDLYSKTMEATGTRKSQLSDLTPLNKEKKEYEAKLEELRKTLLDRERELKLSYALCVGPRGKGKAEKA